MPPSDKHFMQLALEAGRKALPECLPNPPVGCVLVREGTVVATGFTQPPHHPHAEAMAMAQVDGDLNDITAYVTLEPCAFHGRTPSCAKHLVDRSISRVVVAIEDPDPRNRGQGLEILRQAGITVEIGVLATEAHAALAPYLALPANQNP
jgi:pyrimidine deaminase RibD-like protein